MANGFDIDAMLERFKERAAAVKDRPMPPIEGPARADFKLQARKDFQDYAIIGDCTGEIVDGVLTLRLDLRGE